MKNLSRSGVLCRADILSVNGTTQIHLLLHGKPSPNLVEVATVRLVGHPTASNEVLVKPYGNLPQQLVEAGVIHPSQQTLRSGGVLLTKARLTNEALAALEQQEPLLEAA